MTENVTILSFFFVRGRWYTQNTLLIFCHGIGGENRSYLTEIHTLCKAEKKPVTPTPTDTA